MTEPIETYVSLEAAYRHFNRDLFSGALPACLITLQRHKGAYGYFCGDSLVRIAEGATTPEIDGDPAALRPYVDEIALNPATFEGRRTVEILSTLVHEMVHLWQHHFGKPSRGGYHNKEWAEHMRGIGLIPSSTGLPGGKETGQRVSHYIDVRGRFLESCEDLLAGGATILYRDRVGEDAEARARTKARSKTKFTCPACDQNAWAKPEARLVCGDCREPMEAEASPEEGG